MERKQFTFYRSFWEGIREIRGKQARCDAYDAIIAYALDGVEPNLDAMPDAARSIFKMARPNLDSARKKAEAGQKGGESKPQANDKQTASKPQASRKQEKEQEKDKDKEQMLKESKKKSAAKFQAPTVEQVEDYAKEQGHTIDAGRFVDYYHRQGWRLSNGQPMKDWKAAVRLWIQREGFRGGKKPPFGVPDTATVRAAYELLAREEEDD